MIDLECQLVTQFGWSLEQIDQTDIESLFPFLFRYPDWKRKGKAAAGRKEVFCDQVPWL